MKKYIAILLCLVVVSSLFLTSCAKKQKEEEVIKIGFIGPLTGPAAQPIGIPHQRGVILGAEMNNAKGIPMEVFYEDDQANKEKAVSAAKFLIDVKKVKIIISPLSGVSFALAPIAKNNNIILFSTGANPKISEINENVFRFSVDVNSEAKTIANYIKKQNFILRSLNNSEVEIKTAAILYINDEFGISEKEAFKNELEKLNISIVGEENYEVMATDTKTQVTKIVMKKPDLIFLAGYGSALVSIVKTLKEVGFDKVVVVDLNLAYPPLSTDYLHLTEGYYGVDFNFNPNNPKIKKFINDFQNKFGNIRVYPNSALEFSVMEIIGEIVKKCNSAEIECLKKNLYNLEFDTILGKVKFDNNRNAKTEPLMLKRIVNGKEEIIE